MKFILLFLFFIVSITSYAQKAFPVVFQSPLEERINSITETVDNDILGAGLRCQAIHLKQTYQGMIWKVTSEFDTISKAFQWADSTCQFNYIEELPNSNIRIIGLLINPPEYSNNQILILTLDSNLNTLSKSTISLGNIYNSIIKIRKLNENYYILGQYNDYTPFILKLDGNTNFSSYSQFESYNGEFTDVLTNGNQLWCFSDNMDSKMGSEMIILNDSMNIISIKQLPFEYDYQTSSILTCYKSFSNAEWYSDSTFLIFSNHLQSYHFGEEEYNTVGFSILDSSLSIQPIIHIGENDTLEHVAYLNALEVDDDHNIYYCSIKNNEISFFPRMPSWVRIGKLDSDLNTLYETTYGGDAFYRGIEIKKTDEGGSIVSALKYDYNTMDYQWDVVFLRTDSLGVITRTQDINKEQKLPIQVFPNPFNECVHLILENDTEIRILDIFGNAIKSEHLKKGEQQINTTDIKPGLYFLEYVYKNQKINCQKIIKL